MKARSRLLQQVKVGQGATLEHLLARAIAMRPFTTERTFAIGQIRRFYACGWSPKDRSNLVVPRADLTLEALVFIGSVRFDATRLSDD